MEAPASLVILCKEETNDGETRSLTRDTTVVSQLDKHSLTDHNKTHLNHTVKHYLFILEKPNAKYLETESQSQGY